MTSYFTWDLDNDRVTIAAIPRSMIGDWTGTFRETLANGEQYEKTISIVIMPNTNVLRKGNPEMSTVDTDADPVEVTNDQ